MLHLREKLVYQCFLEQTLNLNLRTDLQVEELDLDLALLLETDLEDLLVLVEVDPLVEDHQVDLIEIVVVEVVTGVETAADSIANCFQ